MLHCDLRVRWKVASDLRFQVAISKAETPSFCGISGGLAPSTRESLAIAIVRFWCAKVLGCLLRVCSEFAHLCSTMCVAENHLCDAMRLTAICALAAEIHCDVGHDASITAITMARCDELRTATT